MAKRHGSLKQPIVLHIEVDLSKIPNKMHLSAQQTYRANVFVDRKKRAKNGYTKHKGRYDD